MSALTLTPDQETALAAILEWFERGREWAMSLQGYAGTGKSTLVQEVAKRVAKIPARDLLPRDPVAFTAPTNKAVKVLRAMAGKAGIPAQCMTIHRLLSLRMSSDGEERQLVKKSSIYESMENYRLVVVDEASMIGDRLFKNIEADAKRYRTRVLFVGDPLQLPPVEFGATALERLAELPCARLEKVVRQAESNPIISLASWLRAQLTGAEWSHGIDLADDGADGIRLVDGGSFMRGAVEALVEATRQKRDVKAIAWRNATVNAINAEVRRQLYGPDASQFVVGERVMAASPAGSKCLYTDCEAVVTGLEERDHRDLKRWRCIYVTLETEDGLTDEVPVIHPDAKAVLDAELQTIARDAKAGQKWLWKEFWSLRDTFADLRPCYAITAHRSQGSTYDDVWVDAVDILENKNRPEGVKCLYVAVTRAARNAHLREFAL